MEGHSHNARDLLDRLRNVEYSSGPYRSALTEDHLRIILLDFDERLRRLEEGSHGEPLAEE